MNNEKKNAKKEGILRNISREGVERGQVVSNISDTGIIAPPTDSDKARSDHIDDLIEKNKSNIDWKNAAFYAQNYEVVEPERNLIEEIAELQKEFRRFKRHRVIEDDKREALALALERILTEGSIAKLPDQLSADGVNFVRVLFGDKIIENNQNNIVGQHTAALQKTTSVSEPSRIPAKAPAVWKQSKQKGDTPPKFIIRHYRPWLRGDGTGLTRPDIKRLDPSLYTALANWLRKSENKLPDDCPVPTKTEALEQAPTQDEGFEPSEEMRSWWRAEGARQRARERQQQKR